MDYRISKYDPRFRADGMYTKEEWTAFSDIGCAFAGEKLTMEAYTEMENCYLSCIESILEASGVAELEIFGLENPNLLPHWENGRKLRGLQLRAFLQDGLREKCWGRLIAPGIYLEFGYDYYLHIGCPLEWSEMEQIVRASGLYLETWDMS